MDTKEGDVPVEHDQGADAAVVRREEYCRLAAADASIDDAPPPLSRCGEQISAGAKLQSRRNLALHWELIRLGFLDYRRSPRTAALSANRFDCCTFDLAAAPFPGQPERVRGPYGEATPSDAFPNGCSGKPSAQDRARGTQRGRLRIAAAPRGLVWLAGQRAALPSLAEFVPLAPGDEPGIVTVEPQLHKLAPRLDHDMVQSQRVFLDLPPTRRYQTECADA